MRLPSHSQARLKIAVGVRHQAVVYALVARKHETQRSVGVKRALLPWNKGCTASTSDCGSDIRIPTQTCGNAQVRPQAELILPVEPWLPAGNTGDFAGSLCVGLHIAHQEVCQSIAGILAVESHDWCRRILRRLLCILMLQVHTRRNYMLAYGLTEVVIQTVSGATLLRRLCPSSVEPAPAHRETFHVALPRKFVHVDIA